MSRRQTPVALAAQAHLPRSSPFAAAEARNTVLSARRQLQYGSQLPLRRLPSSCSARRLHAVPRRCLSTRSCRPEDEPGAAKFLAAVAAAPGGRRSLSMSDLARTIGPAGEFEAAAEPRSESGSQSARLDDLSDRRADDVLSTDGCTLVSWASSTVTTGRSESWAANLVCRRMLINAWRRRRQEVASLEYDAKCLAVQLEQAQRQLAVLRRLLDNENTRVNGITGELQRLKGLAEEAARERDQMKNDKEAAEEEARKQRDISDEQAITTENLRNDLRSAQDQVQGLDQQITKERDKLLKLREEKQMLDDKISSYESLDVEREKRAEKAEMSLEDMQMQLATQISITSSLQDEVRRFHNILKEKEEEKAELKKILREIEMKKLQIEDELQLSLQREQVSHSKMDDLECKVEEQVLKLESMKTANSTQMLEINELRERIIRLSQESGWSSKVLQFAGSVVRAPQLIFRTLSFFTTGVTLIL